MDINLVTFEMVTSCNHFIILFLILMRALVFLLHRALSCDELSHGDSCDAGICIWLHNTFLHVFGLLSMWKKQIATCCSNWSLSIEAESCKIAVRA